MKCKKYFSVQFLAQNHDRSFLASFWRVLRNDICVIDYQWTGPANIATDLVYMIATGMKPPIDVKSQILTPYYNYLKDAYHDNGKKSNECNNLNMFNLTEEQLEIDFSLSLLDFMRWCVPGRKLGNETPLTYARRKDNIDINLGRWRRDVHLIAWLFEQTTERLEKLGYK